MDYDVVIVGAGPYGLSAGAYLKAAGLNIRVFGQPMDFWANKMPAGMLLRSPPEASSIADPKGAFTLEAYEKACAVKPKAPLPLDTFVEYGRWFQKNLVPDLDGSGVSQVRRTNSHFDISLNDGATLSCQRLVIAAGVGAFGRKPTVFANLPPDRASHCYEGRSVAELAGKRVAVVGAGQSALESAALLHEAGSDVEVIARIPQLRWIGMHPWLHRLGPISAALYSKHDIGPAGISRLVASPNLVFHIPLDVKDKIRKRAVRSAGSRWLVDRIAPIKVSTGRTIQNASFLRDCVQLKLDDGSERKVDHVLLGTGYDVDISRYNFLCSTLLADVRKLGGYPELKAGLGSSVPGLHFIGATAARSFGPLLNFVAGTEFAAKELTSHICNNRPPVR